MIAVENEAKDYDSLFALMAQSDEDDNDEVNFRDVQRNLKSYSSKKLMALANVLIDTYYSFVNDKDSLIIELGDAKQSRDDLMVVVVDLKETIENFSKEKNTLVEKIAATEQEMDDMIVSTVDLREQVEEMDNTKGEEVASEAQLELKSELNKVKTNLVAELEKNRQLQEDLKRVKNDLYKSFKWTRFSDVIRSMYRSNAGNRQGIELQKAKTSYNPYNKYVTVVDNRLCTHYGQTGHYKVSCKAKIQSLQKNKVFIEKRCTDEEPGCQKRKYMLPAWAEVRGSNQKQKWYMDYFKHKIRRMNDVLSLKALQGESISFENDKKGYILVV
ncbi:uncharacterized protein [Nicotiana sylvestris]|uniref:uncharacterized protein n=1 Tax=Nicotiana sylvestris TaxID=4096 RepID=UPI00388C7CE8